MAQSTAARLAAIRKDKFGRHREAARSAATTLTSAGGDAIGLTVEIFVNSAWTDITPYVYYRDFVRISRGRPDEMTTIQPQTCTMTINNRDGRFSPRNPSGPYYGQIGRNTPIRVSRLQNGIRRYRFTGEVTAWPTDSDITGTDIYASITASGILRRLRQGTPPAYSAMYRAYLFQEVPTLVPVAYWPCEEGANATSFGSAIAGDAAMTFTGTPTLASNTAFACSAPLPVLNSSTWTGTVSPYAAGTANVLRFLMNVPTGGDTNGAIIARYYTTGTVQQVDLSYGTGGSMAITGYDGTGTQLFTSGALGFNVNGALRRVSVDLVQSGADITYQIQTYQVGATQSGSFSATLTSANVGNVYNVVINPNANLVGTAIGHVSLQSNWTTLNDLRSQVNAWIGEDPATRITRLCGEQGINSSYISYGQTGDTTTMGYQLADSLVNLIQQVPDSDLGLLFEPRDQLAIAYRSRLSLYNQGTSYNPIPLVLTLDYSQHNLSAPAVPVDDDLYTRNDVTVIRIGGSSNRQQLLTGSLSTQSPPDGVGSYSTSVGISLGDDGQVADQAGWRLHIGTVDEPRYPSINLNLRHETFTANLDTMNAALSLDVGDRIIINNPPGWLPADPFSLIVQGYQETLGIFEHDMVINCSPESPYRIAMLDDAVLSVADTDGSTLATAVDSTTTTLSVATTNPLSALWTTNAGDFPFDIVVGGERMTVTNVTGSSTPQTFTVTRSVNGVVKNQTVGTDIRLWQPMILSL